MKNVIEINGDVAVIRAKRRSGEVVEFLVDAADLPLLQAAGHSWYAWWDRRGKKYYAATSMHREGKTKMLYLHRLLLGPSPLLADHINRNTLDNRRENLRLVTYSVNNKNRSASALHRGGHPCHHGKGVTYHKQGRRWQAQVFVNGKTVYVGCFATKEAARQAAADKRAELGID